MTNLRQDSVVSNAISADTDFEVNYRRVELRAPFLLVCATDGCFGYLPSPMHFERLVLNGLAPPERGRLVSDRAGRRITAVAGDDAAMALIAVGADLDELEGALRPAAGRARRPLHRPDRRAEPLRCSKPNTNSRPCVNGISTTPNVCGAATSPTTSATCTPGRPMTKPSPATTMNPTPEPTGSASNAEESDAAGSGDVTSTDAESGTDGDVVPEENRSGPTDGAEHRRGGVVVKAGDVINGYLILEDFKVVGAGLSKWTYAERGGRAVLHQRVPQPHLSRRRRPRQ